MTPEPGDGTLHIPLHGENDKMPGIDLPESVAQHMLTKLVESTNFSSELARNATQENNNIIGRVATRKFDELGPDESRAVSGVMATPIASPTTQAGS